MSARAARMLSVLLAPLTLLAGCGGGGGGNDDDTNEPGDPVVAVAVTPTTATLAPNASRTFTATVTGATNTAVTWTASGGTVTTTGVYTAPAATGTYLVRATSVADTSKVAAATVNVRTGVTKAVTITPLTTTVVSGATRQFTATATGFSNPAITWTATGGTISSTGLYTAPENGGSYIVRATSVEDPSFGAEARVTVTSELRLSPSTVRLGTNESLQFTATRANGSAASVTWSATAGTITAAGLYKAPATAGTSVTVTATSTTDPSVKTSVTFTVAAITVAVTPATATVARGDALDFNATATGATTSTAVTWTASVGTIDANGLFTAPTTGTTATITATSVADPSRSGTATVTLIAPLPNVTVTVTPSGIQLAPGGVYDFESALIGSTNTSVVWTSTAGSIDASGVLTAGTTEGTFEVRATSVANPNRSGFVAVKVDAIPVNISPRSATVVSGGFVQFTATVGGTGAADGVTWTTTGGSIDANGRFTGTAIGTFVVTATSKTDTTKSNTSTVVVTAS